MTKKFTEMEKALLEGGHSIDDVEYTKEWPFVEKADEPFSFLKELHEARMTRNDQDAKVLTYTDCCERTFLILLIIELLYKFPKYKPAIKSYASRTTTYDNYTRLRTNATDLYNLIYFVIGDDAAMKKLKDPDAAMRMRKNTQFPLMQVNRYISGVGHNQKITTATQMFIKLESVFKIYNADYRTVRRNILGWNKLTQREREDTTTRLLIASRAKLRNSDIIDDLEKFAADKDFETGRVRDNEPKVSVPDIDTVGKDFMYYRYIVGQENVMMAKKFLDFARNGQSIPSNMVQAYLPAVKMLDDIISGGPSYIQMLRNLQQKAKKGR